MDLLWGSYEDLIMYQYLLGKVSTLKKSSPKVLGAGINIY